MNKKTCKVTIAIQSLCVLILINAQVSAQNSILGWGTMVKIRQNETKRGLNPNSSVYRHSQQLKRTHLVRRRKGHGVTVWSWRCDDVQWFLILKRILGGPPFTIGLPPRNLLTSQRHSSTIKPAHMRSIKGRDKIKDRAECFIVGEEAGWLSTRKCRARCNPNNRGGSSLYTHIYVNNSWNGKTCNIM